MYACDWCADATSVPSTASSAVHARDVEVGEHRPPSGDLDRVDDDSAAVERCESRDVVAVPHPALDEFRIERFGPDATALVVDHRERRLEKQRVGLVEHDQHAHDPWAKFRSDSTGS